MPEELQKDPLTRGQFLLFGALGTFVGAVMTIPPVVYFLDPAIKSVLQGRSDIPDDWVELGSVFDIPAGKVVAQLVKFTQRQTYDSGLAGSKEGSIPNAVLLSWKDGKMPELIKGKKKRLSGSDIEEINKELNVMNNACAHMGCPTRWSGEQKLILCPCHGGMYDINGKHTAGPPPHGLWRYDFQVRGDGGLFVRHDFHLKGRGPGKPYVV
ncbi:MAG TPA: Rieske 2Fe-2S domain-containing protein [Rubrobacteraceae bacterium]|nr:Rieske 2Fe-2S domain-containing protein [Rubrobacteraceae bacterium]